VIAKRGSPAFQVVLVYENFQGFQKAEDGFFADFGTATNTVFLWAHVHSDKMLVKWMATVFGLMALIIPSRLHRGV